MASDLAPTGVAQNRSKSQPTLCIAYGVFGLPKETSGWQKAPPMPHGKMHFTAENALRSKFKPEILGSSPKDADINDPDSTKLLHAAMRASYPNDVEVCYGEAQPACMNHSFVLQQSSTSTLYGVALQIWSKADDARSLTINELRKREGDIPSSDNEVYWIPYALCFLSPYPLFNLLGSYVRAMWIHWSKASSNLFHAEEVGRILSFPAPRLQDIVRIDMKDYALTYKFPASPSEFQNFDMWPLFACLPLTNIVGILETALSPRGRVLFMSRYPAILNIASESVRLACRVYEWTGLYVPVAHCSAVKSLVNETGPYIIGITSECRDLFEAPADSLLIDLDRGMVRTQCPPVVFSKASSRQKFVSRLSAALGNYETNGVPEHLRLAYPGNQLTPEGQVVAIRGRIEVIEDPIWWNQAAVLAVCDHVCRKLAKNRGAKALISGSQKPPLTTKISTRKLQELEREKESNAREVQQAWSSYCLLKAKTSTEIAKLTKRNEFLVDELGTWKAQFEKFQAVAQDLTNQSLELKRKIENYKSENKKLNMLIKDKANENHSIQREREAALQSCEDLTREKQHLKERLRLVKTQNNVLLQQRDEVEAVLRSLRQLIETQPVVLGEVLGQKSGTTLSRDSADRYERSSSMAADHSSALRSSSNHPQRAYNKEHAKTGSVSDAADLVVREKTKEITQIISRITADCIAALDRININDDDADSPFDSNRPRSTSETEGEGSVVASSDSNKRRSDMTAASEAIENLALDSPVIQAPYKGKRAGDVYQNVPFSRATIQEIRI